MKQLIVTLSLLLLWSVPALAAQSIGDLQFATDFDSLMAQAQQSQKVIVIDWFTDW
jgi:hypothetical protein